MKFGGSCLRDSEAFNKILDIVDIYQDRGSGLVFVASALQNVTNKLFDLADLAKRPGKHPSKVDKIIAELEKRHLDVVEDLFVDKYEPFGEKVEEFLEIKFSEIESILDEINEFGLEPYYLDYLVSYGERLSTFILATFLESREKNTMFVPGEEIIITDDNYNNALPLFEYTKRRVQDRVVPIFQSNVPLIFCVTGYFGRNKIGYTTTMGRGGSDFTATILARSLQELEASTRVKVIFWKDVDGLLFTSPQYCADAALIHEINYEEAIEMAFFGAKVLHPKCLAAIGHLPIPVEIRNFDKPLEGTHFTYISDKSDEAALKGISVIENAALISVTSGTLVETPGVLGKIFTLMGAQSINVSLVAQSSSEVNTTFVVKEADAEPAMRALTTDEYFDHWFEVSLDHVAILGIIGKRVKDSQTKARVYRALADHDVNIIAMAQASDGLNVSLVVKRADLKVAVRAIHDEFTLNCAVP